MALIRVYLSLDEDKPGPGPGPGEVVSPPRPYGSEERRAKLAENQDKHDLDGGVWTTDERGTVRRYSRSGALQLVIGEPKEVWPHGIHHA